MRACAQATCLIAQLLALAVDYGSDVYFQPQRELDVQKLLDLKQLKDTRIFIAHDFGDTGFTSSSWRCAMLQLSLLLS